MPPRKSKKPEFSVKSLTFAQIQELRVSVSQAKRFQFGQQKWIDQRREAGLLTKRDSVMRQIWRGVASDERLALRFSRVRDQHRPSSKTLAKTPRTASEALPQGDRTYRFRRLAALDDDGIPIVGEKDEAEIEFIDKAGLTKGEIMARIDEIEAKSNARASINSPPIGKGLLIPIEVRGPHPWRDPTKPKRRRKR